MWPEAGDPLRQVRDALSALARFLSSVDKGQVTSVAPIV
jgi:hypothetical protein